jgi:putative flippase GtrA
MHLNRNLLEDVRTKFVAVGVVNTLAGFGIFTVFYFVLNEKLSYLLILIISQIFAVIFSHSTQRKLVWKSKKPFLPELAKFGSSYVLITFVNIVLLSLAVETLELSVLFSQYVIGAILVLSMYFIQKKWIFAKSNT